MKLMLQSSTMLIDSQSYYNLHLYYAIQTPKEQVTLDRLSHTNYVQDAANNLVIT
jgi:hypothetical protein